jgi:2-ketocyclohexanecarboxyl-CoA hydrolase
VPDTSYTDIVYEEKDGVATITANRPEALNPYRNATYGQVTDALHRAGWNRDIG